MLIQQIAFEVEDRDAFLKALAHLASKGVKLINGPLIHGFEGGGNLGGSCSRSFYFLDPDGNRLEIFTDMMRVPNGDTFRRPRVADLHCGNPRNSQSLFVAQKKYPPFILVGT